MPNSSRSWRSILYLKPNSEPVDGILENWQNPTKGEKFYQSQHSQISVCNTHSRLENEICLAPSLVISLQSMDLFGADRNMSCLHSWKLTRHLKGFVRSNVNRTFPYQKLYSKPKWSFLSLPSNLNWDSKPRARGKSSAFLKRILEAFQMQGALNTEHKTLLISIWVGDLLLIIYIKWDDLVGSIGSNYGVIWAATQIFRNWEQMCLLDKYFQNYKYSSRGSAKSTYYFLSIPNPPLLISKHF